MQIIKCSIKINNIIINSAEKLLTTKNRRNVFHFSNTNLQWDLAYVRGHNANACPGLRFNISQVTKPKGKKYI